MRRLAAVTLALLALSPPAAAAPPAGEIDPSMRFPLLGEDRLASLADFRGEKVLLIEFASW